MAEELDVDLLNKVDEKLRKREYIRNMMRIYRKQDKEGLLYLRNRVKELENELDRLVKTKAMQKNQVRKGTAPLSWKEVAVVFKEERMKSQQQQEQLVQQQAEIEMLVSEMKSWISMSKAIQYTPNPTGRTWRNTSLFAQPKSRMLGKAWITEQMYHNAERMYRSYGFPSLEQSFESVEIHFNDGVFDIVHLRQSIVEVPVKPLLKLYRKKFCDIALVNWFKPVLEDTSTEETEKTTMHQLNLKHSRDEYVHVLAGEFHDDANQQSLFVAQQIIDDEAVRHDLPQRNRMFWLQVLPLPGTNKMVLRMLYLKTQLFTHSSGYIPLEREARVWGIDLSTCATQEQREAKFRRGALEVIHKGLVVRAHERLGYYLARLNSPEPLEIL